jgi:branched-chain amino acid transport system permease protein
LIVTDRHWLVFGCTFALLTAIQGFLSTSRFGRHFQRLLEGERPVSLTGVEESRLRLLACGLGAALAGVGGVLAGLYLNEVYPDMGIAITHKTLALVLIGTLGNLHGAVLAAFAFALTEGVVLPMGPLPLPSEAVLLVVLALVGCLRPAGREGPHWRQEGEE